MFFISLGWLKSSAILVVTTAIFVHAACSLQIASLGTRAAAADKKRPPALEISDDVTKLPELVADMRAALLDAARRGSIGEMIEPIQMNELKPDFGDVDATKPIEAWKKLSIDGKGSEILAIIINLLESPYAITRQGADIENNKMYTWPYFAELPIDKLPPHLETQLLRLIPREDYETMKKTGRYMFWRITIGADGTWHSFSRQK